MRPFLPALLLLAACESGLSTVVIVDVADAVAASGSPDAPLVLVTDAGYAPAALAPLCGDALAEPVTYSVDHGFGCLDDREGTEETLRAWAQPIPDGWDAAAFCALEPHAYAGLSLGTDVTGEVPADTGADTGDTGALASWFPAEPDPAWPQGSVTATWARDFSPCGGILKGEIVVE